MRFFSLYQHVSSSYRGFGCASDSTGRIEIDELAAKIGKDPYEFRLPMRPSCERIFFPGMRLSTGLERRPGHRRQIIGCGEHPYPRHAAPSRGRCDAALIAYVDAARPPDGSVHIMTAEDGSHTYAQNRRGSAGSSFEMSTWFLQTPRSHLHRLQAPAHDDFNGQRGIGSEQEAIQQMVRMAADVLK